jgi:hypothetical protein
MRLVTFDEVAEGEPQGVVVERAPEADGGGDVVGRARPLHPVQLPQAALDGCQRQPFRPEPGSQRRAAECRLSCAGGPQASGETGDGRGVEDVAQGYLAAERRPDPGHQAGGQE